MAAFRLVRVAAVLVPLTAFGQAVIQTVPVPSDPLELATGPIQTANTPEERAAAIKLFERARNNYHLQRAGVGYELKVSFTAKSGGVTEYDGNWQFEEMFAPKLGSRLTAETATYKMTLLNSGHTSYSDAVGNNYPLILHEAYGTLFGPLAEIATLDRDSIRTTIGTFNGVQLTCVLFSSPSARDAATSGRNWSEAEECINSQTGLLTVHSLIPGRYAVYDYRDGLPFHGHILPRKVTLAEAGIPVLELHVDSLDELSSVDPDLFTATEQMKAKGAATEMAGCRKLRRFDATPAGEGVVAQPIAVFGLLTPSGEILETHSLQPSNPNSQAAVEAAKSIHWNTATPDGARPQQREIFIIETVAENAP